MVTSNGTRVSTDLPWLTANGLHTLESGYLLEGESPIGLYKRVAKAAAQCTAQPQLEPLFYEALIKNWLCLASPVAANLGTERGLPISCFGISVDDSIDSIFKCIHELAMMSKNGGGVGICLSNIRGRGYAVSNNGLSEGVIPWAKLYDTTIVSVSQGATRRGAASVNLNINHTDYNEFMNIRRPTGDVNRQCLNLNHAVQIPDSFMHSLEDGNETNREKWIDLLRTRIETGEPYITFSDTANNANPQAYKQNGLTVEMTNICSEISLYSDPEHSFVCCLSSLNLSMYDEWADYKFSNGMTLPELAIWFLDGVMEEFIIRAAGIPGFEHSVAFAIKSRALGLGVLGWHTYLQAHELPFDTSVEVMGLNYRIFSFIKQQAEKASQDIAAKYGEPKWCQGTGMRNTHLMALAPTVTNSIISGGVSPSIEPIAANAYTQKTAKGTFTYKNPILEQTLERSYHNTPQVWSSIVANEGSVQHLDFLSAQQKEIFLTAREINQFHIINQAAQRAPLVDQSQSINLFFPSNVDANWFHRLHFEAWKRGLKSLYYCRSSSVLKGDVASRYYDPSCTACEG